MGLKGRGKFRATYSHSDAPAPVRGAFMRAFWDGMWLPRHCEERSDEAIQT